MGILLNDVQAYLIAQGVGGNFGSAWPIYCGVIPNESNQVISLFDTGGMPFDTLSRANERDTFQTRVRGNPRFEYTVVYNQWLAVFNALQDAQEILGSPVLLPGVFFIQAMHAHPVAFSDDLSRPNFISNWRVYRSRE